jgi:hypothetical protein
MGADPPTLLICFSHPPPPLFHLLPLILTTSVSAFLIPPHSLYRHAVNPPPEATYDDVDALKAACRQHAAAHLYSVTTERSDYKMGVLLLHCGKSGTREGGEGGRSKSAGWEDQPPNIITP